MDGVIYFATGTRYVAEARQSAASLSAVMPTTPVALISDDKECPPEFSQLVAIDGGERPLLTKIRAMALSPYERTLFLDSDTLVMQPIAELFDLLERFDVAAAHAPFKLCAHLHPEQRIFLGGVPQCFPEFNTGVIAFRNSPAFRAMVSDWAALYEAQLAGTPRPWTWDQLSFRETVYKSTLRIGVIPNEYNCRLPFPQVTTGPIKVLHGRHQSIRKIYDAMMRQNPCRIAIPERFRSAALFIPD